MAENKKLPTIAELYSGDMATLSKQGALQALLNHSPKADWIKVHPYVKNKYIPIERIEWLMTKLFLNWRVEIKSITTIANSVVAIITLHYQDPINQEWNKQDGVGASPIQTDKDAGATDFSRVKTDAVMKAAPAAESYAVKDAAEKIGKIFGKDLNRADQIVYSGLVDMFKEHDMASAQQIGRIESLINTANLDEDRRQVLEREIPTLTVDRANEMIQYLNDNQLDPVHETGQYSQTDIKNHD